MEKQENAWKKRTMIILRSSWSIYSYTYLKITCHVAAYDDDKQVLNIKMIWTDMSLLCNQLLNWATFTRESLLKFISNSWQPREIGDNNIHHFPSRQDYPLIYVSPLLCSFARQTPYDADFFFESFLFQGSRLFSPSKKESSWLAHFVSLVPLRDSWLPSIPGFKQL